MQEVLSHAPERITQLLYTKETKRELNLDTVGEVVSRDELDERFPSANHQGIVVSLRPSAGSSLNELLQGEGQSVIIALDQVQDPHNVGAIFRAAECFGAAGVVLCKDRSAKLTNASRKVSAGASELVPWAQVTNLSRAIEQAKKKGFWVIAASASDDEVEATDISSLDVPWPVFLVLGSEGRGVRQGVQKLCDLLVQIPMRGKLDSLNVSQAASVLLFELDRKKQLN